MTGTQIANYDEQWAEQAQTAAEQEQVSSGSFISTRGGTMSLGDQELPGNQVCAIVIDSVKENTYYAERYNPEIVQAPVCYAFGRGNDAMAPHPSMQAHAFFKPQNDTCDGCPKNEWGSSDTGRGKACQNRRRLALLPAGFYAPKKGSRDFDLELFTDPAHFAACDPAYLKLPVMSVKEWGNYVQQISSTLRRPPHGVITRIFTAPDPKSQYKIKFELVEPVPPELTAIIMQRHDAAAKTNIPGYQPPEQRESGGVGGGSLKGLRGRR